VQTAPEHSILEVNAEILPIVLAVAYQSGLWWKVGDEEELTVSPTSHQPPEKINPEIWAFLTEKLQQESIWTSS
jgi:hypothetical protein